MLITFNHVENSFILEAGSLTIDPVRASKKHQGIVLISQEEITINLHLFLILLLNKYFK